MAQRDGMIISVGLSILGWVLLFLVLAVLLSACATKRYGRLTPVAPLEAERMTCEDIAVDLARVAEFERQIASGAQINALSILAFANDLGIGNAIERQSAERTARERRAQLEALAVERGCSAQ